MRGRIFMFFMVVLIFLNIIAVAFETVEPFYFQYAMYFNIFEAFSIILFTVEYILRLWICTYKTGFGGHIGGRIKYALTPMALVDLVSVLPFYLPMFMAIDLRTIKALRLMRLFRIFKLGRYSTAFMMFKNVIREKKEELLLSAFMIFIALMISSTLMYYLEHEAQPEKFSNIPAAMWWGGRHAGDDRIWRCLPRHSARKILWRDSGSFRNSDVCRTGGLVCFRFCRADP